VLHRLARKVAQWHDRDHFSFQRTCRLTEMLFSQHDYKGPCTTCALACIAMLRKFLIRSLSGEEQHICYLSTPMCNRLFPYCRVVDHIICVADLI
jgi:hypothetical protein